MANLPNGKVLMWSASSQFIFTRGGKHTYTTVFDPVANATTPPPTVNVWSTGHEMFCPGTTNLPDGRILVSGGSDAGNTSIYTPATNTWSTGGMMNIPRAYQANTLLSDGSVFTLGGSWEGGQGGKNGERWNASTETWSALPNVPVGPALGPDPDGVYRGDNHMWLFTGPDGRVLQAGPSADMNWIDPRDDGSITPAGPRGDDPYSINAVTVMYEAGKILKVGGAPAYVDLNRNITATTNSYIIDLTSSSAPVTVTKLRPPAYTRAFANGVVLPNGQVVILGGMHVPASFSDATARLTPELWDPVTQTFTTLPDMAAPRTYHSTALLLPDARLMTAGGGLCSPACPDTTNHPDLQILTPWYLLNADGTPATRPAILSAPAQATHGTSIVVQTDTPIQKFSLVRLSSVTHTVNNDQRRVGLTFSAVAGQTDQYSVDLPSNPNILLPGYYMLFALDARGVPSVSSSIRISGTSAPKLEGPGPQSVAVNAAVSLPMVATPSAGTLRFSATGLPAGLSIDGTTGTITGNPTTAGTFASDIRAADANAATTVRVFWTIN